MQFEQEAGDDRFQLMVDLERADGRALLDVEYWQVECDAAEPSKDLRVHQPRCARRGTEQGAVL